MLQRRTVTVALLAAGLTVSATPAMAAPPSPTDTDLKRSEKIRQAVTVDGTMAHLAALQRIADANDGNRAAGTPGYEASAQYVEQQLKQAGYTSERQYFDILFEQVRSTSLEVVSPDPREVAHNPMSYSPATPPAGITAELVKPVDATGCDASAWSGVDAEGKIALVSRGGCTFGAKSAAAGAAGAAAIIIYNNTDGALSGTLGGVDPAHVPTAGITQAEGNSLLAAMASGPVTMKFVLDKIVETRKTFNIIAETKGGDPNDVVMLGAHLDSVQAGPGINDNGSGSAAILEVARQFQQKNLKGKPENKVRFAWWGAEEIGLLGSTHYIDHMKTNSPEDLEKIKTYLNFDMVASPNYIIGVYDADQSTHQAPVDVPAGSIATENVFTDYFDAIGQPWVDTQFSGRSDYQAFIENGIAAGGLFTGADGSKTAEEVAMFGGTEGAKYDPNYHTPEDDLAHIDTEALGINVDAIAHATVTLAEAEGDLKD